MKAGMKTVPAQDIDEYLASVPEKERAVPEGCAGPSGLPPRRLKERISCGIPAFRNSSRSYSTGTVGLPRIFPASPMPAEPRGYSTK